MCYTSSVNGDIASLQIKLDTVFIVVKWTDTIQTGGSASQCRIALMGVRMEMCRWIVLERPSFVPVVGFDKLLRAVLSEIIGQYIPVDQHR